MKIDGKEIQIERLRDPKFYLENFCKIKTKKRGLEPFILNNVQLDMFNTMRKYNRIMLLKARQLGASTGVVGYFYVDTIMNPGTTTALIGYNSDLVTELLDKVQTFWRTTPAEFRPTIKYNSKYEISFPKIDSKIIVLPSTGSVGAGYTLSNVLMTEFSKWDNAEEKMMTLEPAVPLNGRIVIETCVTGDTLILTDKGLRRMINIYDWKNNDLGFSIGNKIRLDGFYGIKETNQYYNSGIRKGFRVVTRTGNELGMSSIHPIMVLRNGELKMIRSKYLKVGDYVATKFGQNLWDNNDEIKYYKPIEYGFNKKNIKIFNPEKINEDLAYLIGYTIGNGYIDGDGISRYRNRVIITTIDKEVQNFLLNNNLGLKFIRQSREDDNIHFVCSNKSFIHWIRNYLKIERATAKYKKIPDIVLTWSIENIKAFLSGLFDSDGSCDSVRGRVSLCSTSKDIINVVQKILLNMGLISRIYKHHSESTKLCKVESNSFILELNQSNSYKFGEIIGFRVKRKQKNTLINKDIKVDDISIPIAEYIYRNKDILDISFGGLRKHGAFTYERIYEVLNKRIKNKDNNVYKNIKRLYELHYFYDEIKEIKEIKENVYDFCIEDGHTFISNGIISHNTPSGVGNLYHRMWVSNEEYVKKEYGWWWGYSREEIETIKRRMNNPRMFAQEYGLSFLTSGNCVFDESCIREQEQYLLKEGDDNNGFIVKREGSWMFYKAPEINGLYCVGVDVGEGVVGGDYSVAIMWDRRTGEEVAMFRGLLAPHRLAEELNRVGRLYNNALMAVEVNNHGLTVTTVLRQLMYPSLYYRMKGFESLGQIMTDRIGWRTTSATRPLLIDDFAQALRDKELKIHSKILLDEMSVFIYNENGEMQPMKGIGSKGEKYHDDTIFAAGIGRQAFKVMYSGQLSQIDESAHLPKNFAY